MGVICKGVVRGACQGHSGLCHHDEEHDRDGQCGAEYCAVTDRDESCRPVKPKAHAAKLENSPRLQRIRDVLLDGRWHTTRDIMLLARTCGVYAWELRANGLAIECELDHVHLETKAKVYRYRLVTPGKGEGE